MFEVNNDPKPLLYNNFNNNNTNTTQPKDSNPNENKKVENQIELFKKEYEKNLENIKKEHKNEIAKIKKNYYEIIDEMKNEFTVFLNSIRNQFKNEMAVVVQEKIKKKASSNLIQVINKDEVHRMYIENTLNELKYKIKKTFNLKCDIKRLYYVDNCENITLNTEEDYEIMIMTCKDQKYIMLYLEEK